jgi:hypothetical protein
LTEPNNFQRRWEAIVSSAKKNGPQQLISSAKNGPQQVISSAKNGPQQVGFVEANRDPRSCSCSYSNPALRPPGVCREWNMPTDSPTNNEIGSSPPWLQRPLQRHSFQKIMIRVLLLNTSSTGSTTMTQSASQNFSLSLCWTESVNGLRTDRITM